MPPAMRPFHRLLVSFRAYLGRSIRRQLAWSFGLVSLSMMVGTGYLLFAQQRSFLYEQQVLQATNLARLLAVSSASWVVARDLVGLDEVTRGFAQTSDLKFAAILTRRGEVLASTRDEQIGHYFSDALSRSLLAMPAQPQVLLSQANLIDVAVPVMAGARHIGWARVELTQASTNRSLQQLGLIALAFVLATVGVVVVVSLLLARRLSRRLEALVRVAEDAGRGGGNLRSHDSGDDEIGVLAHDFNRMLDALSAQQDDLGRRNAELAMYNQVLQQIGQDLTLPMVLEGLALRVETLSTDAVCAIFLLEPGDGRLRLQAAPSLRGGFRQRIEAIDLADAWGTTAQVVARDGTVLAADVMEDPAWAGERELAQQAQIRACWAFPVRGRTRQLLGVFTVYRRAPGGPDEGDTRLMERCASLAGLAMERKQQDDSLRVAATAFETQEGMAILDNEQHILRVNQAFSDMFGYEAQEVIGRKAALMRSDRHPTAYYLDIWARVVETGAWQGEIWHQRKNGEVFPDWTSLTAVHGDDGQISHYVAAFIDISERKAAEAEIQQLAFYDPLTGLPNRRLLLDQLRHAVAACRRNHRQGALLFLDLDNFKSINDTLGHDKGDLLLSEVARRLTGHIRGSDIVARLGGDEFVVMLDELAPDLSAAAREVEVVSSKLLAALRQPYELEGVSHYSSASIGVALFGEDSATVEDLLKRADLALHQAKSDGRDAVRFFDPEMQAAVSARVALERDLRQGLQAGEFLLYYQPQIDGVGRMTGAEVLLRWQHPTRGMVSPATFIPLAEETGLILPLGRWVLEQACAQLAHWAAQPQTAQLTLAVNVSARELRQDDFVEQVLAVLQQTGAPARGLKLELTESLVLDNVEDSIAKMKQLQAQGVGFSLDDFGTGFSSLNYLKRLPLDQLKIDQSFVYDALSSPNDAAIVQTIVALGRSLRLNVIAEGVETWEQREFLAREGCHHVQGYLFGRPGPVENLAALMAGQAISPPVSDAADR